MEAVTTALNTAVGEIVSSTMGLIGSILPLALPVIGAIIVVKFGIKLLKSLTSKA